MDHSDIERENVVERYLQGRLSAEDATAFEAHLLDCGECFEAVRWADDMGRALRVAAAEDVSRLAVGSGLLAWLARLPRFGQLSLATLLAVAVLVPAVLTLRAPGAAPRGNTPVFFLAVERDAVGTNAPPSQQIRPSADHLGGVVLALELDATSAEASTFRAVVKALNDPEGVLWQGGGLRLDHNAVLTLSFPADFFAPGDYEVRVTPEGGRGDPLRFPFRMLAPES